MRNGGRLVGIGRAERLTGFSRWWLRLYDDVLELRDVGKPAHRRDGELDDLI